MNIRNLQNQLEETIDLYLQYFCEKQETDFEFWVANRKGGIVDVADCSLNFDDIRLDLELNAPKGLIFEWYWENIDAEQKINYYHYIKGLRFN